MKTKTRKTKLTKRMRQDIVQAMMVELCQPKIESARKTLVASIDNFLRSVVPPSVITAYEQHPEFFCTLSGVYLGKLGYASETIHLSNRIPIDLALQYNHLPVWAQNPSFADKAFFKSVLVELGNYNQVIKDYDKFNARLESILEGLQWVEDIQTNYPEAMRFVTLPETSAPVMVRADALKNLVENYLNKQLDVDVTDV